MSVRTAFVVLAFAAAACGVSSEPSTPLATSTAALACDSEPTIQGDVATSAGCAFEQQYANIQRHGHDITAGPLSAGGTPAGVTVSRGCGQWFLGTDAQGTQVFVSAKTGEVRAHGWVHAGQGGSTLPHSLALPIAAP